MWLSRREVWIGHTSFFTFFHEFLLRHSRFPHPLYSQPIFSCGPNENLLIIVDVFWFVFLRMKNIRNLFKHFSQDLSLYVFSCAVISQRIPGFELLMPSVRYPWCTVGYNMCVLFCCARVLYKFYIMIYEDGEIKSMRWSGSSWKNGRYKTYCRKRAFVTLFRLNQEVYCGKL